MKMLEGGQKYVFQSLRPLIYGYFFIPLSILYLLYLISQIFYFFLYLILLILLIFNVSLMAVSQLTSFLDFCFKYEVRLKCNAQSLVTREQNII